MYKFNHLMFWTLCAATILFAALAPAKALSAASISEDKTAFRILAYSRIGENEFPDSNLRTEQFREQLKEMLSGNYNIMSLPDALKALKNHQKLAKNSLVITFEGGYRSSYENAMRPLLERGIPFTVFYASDHASSGLRPYLSWHELMQLSSQHQVTLGILPASHVHLTELDSADIRSLINKAKKEFRDHFGHEASYFSLPYGELTEDIENALSQYSFEARFGIHSGVAHEGSNLQFLPRFTLTESYGSLDRFRLIANALPLPAEDIQPYPPEFGKNLSNIGFTVPQSLQKELSQLSCFVSGQDKVNVQTLDRRVEIRSADSTPEDRLRVNCTMPGPETKHGEAPTWRWLGMLLTQTGN